jgi:hypothetical protein
MITPEMIIKALETSHDNCYGQEGCVHKVALEASNHLLHIFVNELVRLAAIERVDPAMFLANAFIHVGYKLRQIEIDDTKPISKERVN